MAYGRDWNGLHKVEFSDNGRGVQSNQRGNWGYREDIFVGGLSPGKYHYSLTATDSNGKKKKKFFDIISRR